MKRNRRAFLSLVPAAAAVSLVAGFTGKCKVEEESAASAVIPGSPIGGEWKDPRPAAPAPTDPEAPRYGLQLLMPNRMDEKTNAFMYALWDSSPKEMHVYQTTTADGLFARLTLAWNPARGYEDVWRSFVSDTLKREVQRTYGYQIRPVPVTRLYDGQHFDSPLQLKDVYDDSPILHGDGYGPIGVWDPERPRRDWDDNPYAGDSITEALEVSDRIFTAQIGRGRLGQGWV